MSEYTVPMVTPVENMTVSPQNCSNCSQVSVPEFSVTRAVTLGLILGIFILFGVMGNILVILSVVCHRHLRTVTHFLIANLAVADLLLSSTVLPFSATLEILGRWVFGRVFCTMWAAMDVLCCTASITSLCMISVDRYIGVSYPLRYPTIVTKRRGLLALACLWALSIIISIAPLFGWKEPMPEDETVCKITEEPAYAIFSSVVSFYLPLTVILVMYCRVYVVARRETKTLKGGHKEGEVMLRIHRGNAAAASETEAMHSRKNIALRLVKFSRQKKAAKTLGIVVGCFILCWLPFFLVMPIGSIFPSAKPSETVFKVVFWLGYFNSCINPMIYPCSSNEFKKAFQNVLGICCRKYKARKAKQLRQAQFSNSKAQGGASRRTSKTALSRMPSTSGGKDCKDLLRTCCCISGDTPSQRAGKSQPSDQGTTPLTKVHQLSLPEKGEAV
ncbi:adrenoceptor alpha 1Aa [Conger conger]|uniref:adrenoceptor alpha 1Aa n=1 Tax=Conger conger TaxID=82655 RepID=UPI002A5A0DE7|nr:adrenoceptor alpha 1Aa [Conger conger]XP_061116722.1 adrenoceptor alpha 1Aa [Conger conger]